MPSEKQPIQTIPRQAGRPPTGRTKQVINATVDEKIVAEAKKVASQNGESFAAFVSRAIHSQLLRMS